MIQNSLKIFSPKKQAGLSLISLMVTLAMIGILALIFSNMFKNQMTITGKIEDRGEIEDLRNYIRIGVDCVETKASWPTSCPNGRVIALKRGPTATSPLVSVSTGPTRTKIGPYFLQAKCNGVADQYMVFYSKVHTSSGNPLFSTPRICP